MHSDALLLDLYASAAQPARWAQVLDRLCDETGACSAVAQTFGFEGDGVRLRWQAMDTQTVRRHPQLRSRIPDHRNPRLDRHRGLRGLNRVVRDDELFDRDDPARGALREQLATIGLGQFMGTLQALPNGLYLGLALHREVGDCSDFSATHATRLARLAPHFGQACALGGRLDAAQGAIAQLRGQLDTLRCGLVVCDAEARVQWMNRSARDLVGNTAGAVIAPGSTLRASGRTGSLRLNDEIAAAAAEGPAAAPRFVALCQGDETLHVALRACADAHAGGNSVLLAITGTRAAGEVPSAAWSRLLGVTPAEACLVATLVRGGSLEQHAAERGVSLGTVRCQLKQVLAKTGTHRQAELVRLALSSAAAHVLASVPCAGN